MINPDLKFKAMLKVLETNKEHLTMENLVLVLTTGFNELKEELTAIQKEKDEEYAVSYINAEGEYVTSATDNKKGDK